MTYLAIDIEASGLGRASFPVEIALAGAEGVRRWLIRPEPHWSDWDAEAEALHGYRAEALATATPAFRVAAELALLIEGRTIYSDAPDWDGFWLDRLYETVSHTPRFRLAWARVPTPAEPGVHRAAVHAQHLYEALDQARVAER